MSPTHPHPPLPTTSVTPDIIRPVFYGSGLNITPSEFKRPFNDLETLSPLYPHHLHLYVTGLGEEGPSGKVGRRPHSTRLPEVDSREVPDGVDVSQRGGLWDGRGPVDGDP